MPAAAALLAQAARHHAAGRRADAEACCRAALAADPRHPGVLHLLADMAAGQGRAGVAERLLRLAAAEPPRDGDADHRADCLNRLGTLLADAGRHADAVAQLAAAVDRR